EGEAGVETPLAPRGLVSNFTRPAYLEALKKVKEYIAAGEVYQVNLSQRFTAPLTGSSFDLYRRLRSISPAPFSAFLRFPELAVGSSSPERFLRIEEDRIETRPIKGTRPRGRTAAEDREFRSELLASAKDQAEHIMIVDLERNDLGTVSRYGTVHVPEITACEEYSTVFHLTSTVEGRLKMGITPVQALAACFPGGSITGAPKIRALSIIDELEPTRRGIYTGALGYLGFDGSADLSVVIRTFVAHRGRVHFQVGGGIVADSDPEAEFQETLDKAAGFLRAIQGERGDEGCGPPGWTGP
ncbi:MAG: aminodeoxychorismate synthase component I, partial [Firmicutes bacterium]|nr:aminodeoxychorismate synthase component I [Bacillota bacterium]